MYSTDSTDSTPSTGAGNTENSACNKVKQPPAYKYWSFTWFGFNHEEIEQIELIFEFECEWYLFQEEICPLTKRLHLQETLCLKQRQRLSSIKKINPKCHWEHTKSVKASIAYCTKIKTATGQVWTYGIDIPKQPKVFDPRGWQIEVLNILKDKPDDRTIYWFWEPDGGVGKTQLCKWLVVKQDAIICSGKANDIFYHVTQAKKKDIILIDVPRSHQDFINYGAIEQVKNGLIFSGKYESKQCVFDCPNVFVFANILPEYSKLSLDRWKVYDIRELIKYHN